MEKNLKKDLLSELFSQYKAMMEKDFWQAEKRSNVSTGDLRVLMCFPPVYVAIVDELPFYQEKLFKCVVLTEELELGWLGKETPIIKVDKRKSLLVALPFWIYILEDFLYEYSEKLGEIAEETIERLIDYAEKAKIPEKRVEGEYIRTVMKRLSEINSASLLEFFDYLEKYEESPQVLQLSPTVAESLSSVLSEYAFRAVAGGKSVFRGENFFAIVEKLEDKAKLIIYLPQEYIGQKVTIALKENTLFEGELERDVFVVEPFLLMADYSFIEEELRVIPLSEKLETVGVFRFEAFEESHFREFLWQELFDDYIEDILKRFELFSPKIQFEIISYLRERMKDRLSARTLAKALNIKIQDAEKIIRGEGRVFEVFLAFKLPSKSKAEADVCKALVIPDTSKVITNLPHLKRKLTVIKKFLNQSFAVFFSADFSGDSFMLPLAVALNIKRVPENLRFTGKLNSKGDILEVEFLQEKLNLAKRKGVKLITPIQVKNFSIIKHYLEKETWDVPFYITSSGKEEFYGFLSSIPVNKEEGGFPLLKGLEIFYEIKEEDFYLITGQLTGKESWIRFCEDFYQKIFKLKHILPGVKKFHLGIRGAVSFSFALGVLFSHFDPFVFYHYQVLEGKPRYLPIEVLTPRVLKERLSEYKIIKPVFEKAGDDLVVILNFSHHEPTADVKNFVKDTLKNPSFLIVETEKKGNLPVELFSDVARETAGFIQKIREEHSFRSYHFFFSCPVAIAFMVGLAFGHYVDGVIYNYEKESGLYKPVLDFKTLRKIREGMSDLT